ncbi:unnamed protein product [Parnassius mnemosyne]|uniref:Uncharacterized protein n=1 Tax=Parnassius mnemosyne TaxID=213953 RepID=A0AAV1LRY3_9NEOP
MPMNGFYTPSGHVCYLINNYSSQQNDNPLLQQMVPAAYSQPLNMIAELNNKNNHVNYNSPAPCPRGSTDDSRSNIFSTLLSLPGTVANSLLNGEITV